MKCSKCGTQNVDTARFCVSCGSDLTISNNFNVASVNNTNVVPNSVPPVSPVPNQVQNHMTNQVPNPVIQQPPVQPANEKPKKSKALVIILIVLAAIALLGGGVFAVTKLIFGDAVKETKKINDIFDSNKPILVKQNDKYGYIDSKGKFIIKAKYEEASRFNGDYAVVRSEVEKDGLKKTVSQVIDKHGKVKMEVKDSIKQLTDVDMWIVDGALYNSDFKKLSGDNIRVGKYYSSGYFIWVNDTDKTGGIMNRAGKITYTYKFAEGESYINIESSDVDDSLTEKYCAVNIENEKYAIVNCDDGTVVYDYSEYYVSVNDDNIFKLKEHSSFDFVSIMYIQNNKIAYQSDNDEISLYYYPGYLEIRDYSKKYSERYSYFDTKKLTTSKEKPKNSSTTTTTTTSPLSEWEKETGIQKMSCTAGYGLTSSETIVLPCEWNSIKFLEVNLYKYLKSNNKDYVYAEKDNKWYLVDLSTKKAIVEFDASYISPSDGTTFVKYTEKSASKTKVYNLLTNKSLSIDNNATVNVYSNYITVKDMTNKTMKYYNVDLEQIYTENI